MVTTLRNIERESGEVGGENDLRGGRYPIVLAIAVTTIAAIGVDAFMSSAGHFISAPFAFPILLATRLRSRVGLGLTTAIVITLAVFSALHDRSPLVPTLIYVVRLLVVAVLAFWIVCQQLDVWRRARDAERAHGDLVAVLNGVTDSFCFLDLDGRITFLNDEARQAIRSRSTMDPNQFIGQNVRDVLPFVVGTNMERQLGQVMAEKVPVRLDVSHPEIGEWWEIGLYPAPSGVSIFARNVSEQRVNEDERRRLASRIEVEQARLEGVKLTAGAIAHQVNNLLALAIGELELGRRKAANNGSFDDARVRRVEDAIGGAAHAIARLHSVVRVETKDSPAGPILDVDKSTPRLSHDAD